jgi:hypothetical protein
MEVSRQRGQRSRGHRVVTNSRLGFLFGSAVLVGLLAGPGRRSVGRRGRAALAEAVPPCAGRRGPPHCEERLSRGPDCKACLSNNSTQGCRVVT